MTSMRIGVVAIALNIAFGLVLGAGSTQRSGKEQDRSGLTGSPQRMADGKEWMTANLNVNASSSYCYADAERTAFDMAVYIRGNRRSEDVTR